MRQVIILTATIAPSVTADMNLIRRDPEVRRRDYEKALVFWLSLRTPWLAGVVFAENSGSDLTSIKRAVESRSTGDVPLEFLSYKFPPPPAGLHYGYSEMCLVREALRDSALLRENDYFFKATGRYTFPTIERLVRRLPAHYDAAVDSKCSRFWSKGRHHLTHFALAFFRREFFEIHLSDLPEKMVPAPPWTRAQFIETMLYDRLESLRDQANIVMRWPVNCEPRGVGANGDDYGKWPKRIGAGVRAVGRLFVPNLWI